MAGINKVILVGNLGKDPEMFSTDAGIKRAKFSLATSENFTAKDGTRVDETEWHSIVLWRGLAEVAEKYLRKGSKIYLEGKIKTNSYVDKDGNKKSFIDIIGDRFEMLDSKPPPPPPPPTGDSIVDPPPFSVSEPEDDLPF